MIALLVAMRRIHLMLSRCTVVAGNILIALAASRQGAFAAEDAVQIAGNVVDAASGESIASRLYIRAADGSWHFPLSTDPRDVVRYERENYWDNSQVEKHATLAAKPFRVELQPGEYKVTAERGKEFLSSTTTVQVDHAHAEWRLPLTRWIDMAARGWYSGDMHAHRAPLSWPISCWPKT